MHEPNIKNYRKPFCIWEAFDQLATFYKQKISVQLLLQNELMLIPVLPIQVVTNCEERSLSLGINADEIHDLRIIHRHSTYPCLARSIARTTALALFTDSSNSFSGTESATIPAPA